MGTFAWLVGGAAGVLLRILLTDFSTVADARVRRRSAVITAVGAVLIGAATGSLLAYPGPGLRAESVGQGLSALLLTFCLFSDATLALIRGDRTMLGSALVQAAIGFVAATVGVTLGAIVPV